MRTPPDAAGTIFVSLQLRFLLFEPVFEKLWFLLYLYKGFDLGISWFSTWRVLCPVLCRLFGKQLRVQFAGRLGGLKRYAGCSIPVKSAARSSSSTFRW